jgi:O-antigen/teichoic acid export membrane protein
MATDPMTDDQLPLREETWDTSREIAVDDERADVTIPTHDVAELSSSRYASYGILAGVAMVLPGLSLFLLGLWLSSGAYGDLVIYSTLNSLVLVGSDSGLNVTTTLAVSRAGSERRREDAVVGGLGARALLWLASTFLALLAYPAVAGGTVSLGGLLAVGLACLGALAASLTAGLRIGLRTHQPLLEARLSLLEKIATAVLVLGLVALTQRAGTYGWAVLIAPLLAVGAVASMRAELRRVGQRLRQGRHWPLVRSQLRGTMPVAIGIYAVTLYWRLDVLLISAILGATAAGSYAIGYYPIMAIANLPGAAAVLVLRTSHLPEGDQFRRRLLFNGLFGVVGLALCSTIGVWLLGILPIHAVTDESLAVLRTASWGILPLFLNPLLAMRLRSRGLVWWVTALTVVGLAVNLTLNLALLGSHGITVAAWASNATEYFMLASCGLLLVLFHRRPVTRQGAPS